jgi:hypothetical protein
MKAFRLALGLMVAGIAGISGTASAQVVKPDSPIIAARKQVTEAQNNVLIAKKALDAARLKVTAAYKAATPDYAKAETEVASAKVKMDQSKIAAQNAAKADPEYRQAAATKDALSVKIKELQASGAEPDDATRTQYMQLASVVSRLESQALEKNAGYAEAKTRYAEALKALEAFKEQLDQACKADPEYMAAEQAMVTAQQTLQTAQDSMKTTQASEAAARAAEAKARAEAAKSKTSAPK